MNHDKSPKPASLKFLDRRVVLNLLEHPRTHKKARDYFLLSLSYCLALRVCEAVALQAKYLRPEYGEVLVPTAKRKPRRGDMIDESTGRPLVAVPILFGAHIVQAAKRWAGTRKFLFPARGTETPISTRQATYTFHRWAKVAGLDRRVSPHSLRHSAATFVQEVVGDDIVLVRDFLRHSNVATTSEYLHKTPQALEKARERFRSLGA